MKRDFGTRGIMQQLFSHKTEKPTIEPLAQDASKGLAGKVVLMIGGLREDSAGPSNGRALVADLAAQGADVALVHEPNASDQAQAAQKLVQAQGRRCLLITAQPYLTSQEIVQQILATLGSLDIFLDFTTDNTNPASPRPSSMPPIDKLSMLVAAMQQMVPQQMAPGTGVDLTKE